MYKDKDKQRGANKERQRRYKAKQKALPDDVIGVLIPAGKPAELIRMPKRRPAARRSTDHTQVYDRKRRY